MSARSDAISHLVGLHGQVAVEFCCDAAEADELWNETQTALCALGVTADELSEYQL